MQRTVIIDYGSGNLHSAAKALERASTEEGAASSVIVSSNPQDVVTADRIVLPGVGAYGDCKRGLQAVEGLTDALEEAVSRRAVPFLGICVGMQLMSSRGLEFETTAGLDWIAGEVVAIAPDNPDLKIPHMGWNTLNTGRPHPLLKGIETGPDGLHAYFVHSFHFVPADPDVVVAATDYGGPVTAMVGHNNLAGTQFHPEKSQTLGLKLLANFLRWQP